MRKTKYNLKDKEFGKLIAISIIRDKGQTKWLCKCICGSIKPYRQCRLLKNKYCNCGCESNYCRENNKLWKGYGVINGSILLRIKLSAKRRNLEFNLTAKYLNDVFVSQNGKCALSGIDIELSKKTQDSKNGMDTASPDRIDSTKGYIVGNIQWVHKDINFMKNYYNQDYFIEMCRKVAKNKQTNSGLCSI